MAEPQKPRPATAEEARQGQVILRTPTRKLVFFGGLAAVVVLPLLLRFCAAG
ncbi:peptide ABC transporter permease [Roseomonas frigidaquae]|uniref:Peptide ABC transporter permease n=1 Tax=Falsiroseomonas frigidaquae TaxID=487318 RepID=A0ABX1F4W8_9PROT|nr:peptide ABC transporter permease [Falsiroseomonas frigidaquae]NKE47385.1 peptide ABC transporter permease [Falsiroseomonas frigidaquae]